MDGVELPGWTVQTNDVQSREWTVKEWKGVIDKKVKEFGLQKWHDSMTDKQTLEWYREKAQPRRE